MNFPLPTVFLFCPLLTSLRRGAGREGKYTSQVPPRTLLGKGKETVVNPSNLLNRRTLCSAILSLLCAFLALPLTTGNAQATPPATHSAQGPGWQIKTTLIPKGWTASTQAYLGWSVAVDGDTLVAGAPAKNGSVGAAEVFVRNGDTWTQQAELVAKDGKANDDFGWAVAIS